jgi:hypothetical protein
LQLSVMMDEAMPSQAGIEFKPDHHDPSVAQHPGADAEQQMKPEVQADAQVDTRLSTVATPTAQHSLHAPPADDDADDGIISSSVAASVEIADDDENAVDANLIAADVDDVPVPVESTDSFSSESQPHAESARATSVGDDDHHNHDAVDVIDEDAAAVAAGSAESSSPEPQPHAEQSAAPDFSSMAAIAMRVTARMLKRSGTISEAQRAKLALEVVRIHAKESAAAAASTAASAASTAASLSSAAAASPEANALESEPSGPAAAMGNEVLVVDLVDDKEAAAADGAPLK